MMKYVWSHIAVVWLISSAVSITSAIGKPPTGSPTTWADAWTVIAALAIAMALGWLAGRESKAKND